MKRRFDEEYKEMLKKDTPDLWSRIEAGLDREEERKYEQVEEKNLSVKGCSDRKDSLKESDSKQSEAVKLLKESEGTPEKQDGPEEQKATEPEKQGDPEEQKVTKPEKQDDPEEQKATEQEKKSNPGKQKNGKKKTVLFRVLGAAAACLCIAAGVKTVNLTELFGSRTNIGAKRNDNDPITDPQTGNVMPKSSGKAGTSGNSTSQPTDNDLFTDGNVYEEKICVEVPAETFQYEAVNDTMDLGYQPVFADNFGGNTERYQTEEENGFLLVSQNPLSTFSADVDTASYSNIRRMIRDGYTLEDIPAAAVRAEEFINYFHYELQEPKNGEKFGVKTEISECPWNPEHQLLLIGLKTEEVDLSETPGQNLVFLLDVSGSMDEPDKLPLLQRAFAELTAQLRPEDTVSIVTYADGVETVLEGEKGSEKEKIAAAVEELSAGGGTNGEGGIQKAYELAERFFMKDGNNRILLATDGDLNIGISEPEELKKLVKEKKETGIYLSVLGFGSGNIRDDNMETLADCGNGNYSYIDSMLEARKVLVEEMGATFHTVAEDVKLQVEFNPERVNAYRQIGYENRALTATDFADDTKDAGEIGAGHSVVVLYEIIPEGSRESVELKYGKKQEETKISGEYATASIRYKEPGQDTSILKEYVIDKAAYSEEPDEDFVFAGLAAEFAMILSDSEHKGNASLEGILETFKTLDPADDDYKGEFYFLVRQLCG